MAWTTIPREEPYDERGDPYFHLRAGKGIPKGFAGPDRSALRPAVIRLLDGDAAAFGRQDGVLVPAFYTNPIPAAKQTAYCTALVGREFIESLKGNSSISRIAVLPPIDAQSVPTSRPSQDTLPRLASPDGEPKPGTVVVGVIDYGIAFAHERFRLNQDETRIEYFWVQDAPCEEAVGSRGPGLADAPKHFEHEIAGSALEPEGPIGVNPVPYGRELDKGEIDGLLAAHGDSGIVDEDTLYRRAAGQLGDHWLRSVSRRVAHGTHVMDVACGYDLDHEDRRKRPIVCVQLPAATTADTSGENLDAYALDGIRYVLDRADAIARQQDCASLPVVINFSYGNVAGPHDGTSDLEEAIDELIKARPNLNVVIPSGNSHLGRLHAERAFDRPGQTVDLHWRVLPDDRTPSFLEIWLPLEAWLPGVKPEDKNPRLQAQVDPAKRTSPVHLRITDPGHSAEGELKGAAPGEGLRLLADNGDVLCEARYHFIGAPTNRGMFLIALQPTRRVDPGPGTPANPVAPSGIWTITLENVSLKPNGLVEAWIQRDDTPYGFPRRGRQSYFDHACYERFDHGGRVREEDRGDCIIRRAGSMNAIATGKRTTVVGGYVRRSRQPAEYSAGGPVAHRWPRRGPDASAVSDESRVLRGVLAAGTRSGSVATLNGTSVAAPQVARAKADELAGLGRDRKPEKPSEGEEGEPRPGIERTGDVRIERLRLPRGR
jgi:hypothetical protein